MIDLVANLQHIAFFLFTIFYMLLWGILIVLFNVILVTTYFIVAVKPKLLHKFVNKFLK